MPVTLGALLLRCFPLLSLQDACLAKQSMDNMSVLVIAFKGAWEEGIIIVCV